MGDVSDMTKRAQQEAEAYRGDNPRPLGGYVAVLVVYGTAVAQRPPRVTI